MKLPIYAPKEWWLKRETALQEDCNGCGSDLDLSGKLVPDTIYGLNIRDTCCCPHDFMYKYGVTFMDKIFADCMFLYNIVATILNKGGILTIPRLLRATKYFIAVVKYGDKSYRDGKIAVLDSNYISFKGEFRNV